MSDLVSQLRALLDETPGGYASKAKIRDLLDLRNEDEDAHIDHPKLQVYGRILCCCGQWMPGMASIALPADTPFIRAYEAAVGEFERLIEQERAQDLSACLVDALLAALKTYGIDETNWFAEAYDIPEER